jgi:mono/diheme cytochrome c family protein/uncharacterized membrane protein
MLQSIICLLVLAQTPLVQPSNQTSLLAQAALNAFTSKCAQCHGTDVPHPKAAFGFVTDLKRLVDSEKYVLPGSLEKSALWKEIDEGDMPPDAARAGPLTPQEIDAIRQWILAGAPPAVGEPPSSDSPALSSREPQRQPELSAGRLITLVGRFHVVVVHFPIALLLVAAFGEAWGLLHRSAAVAPSVRLCLSLGAFAALLAAGLGWVRGLDGFAGPLSDPASGTGLHRWIGTGAGVAAPMVALLSERDARRGGRSAAVRAAVIALGVLVGIAGHFGGLLTHGTEFFDP